MARLVAHLRNCSVGRLAIALGASAGLAVVLTLADPGITVDEPLDVRPGRTYVATLRARGLEFFAPEVVDAVFRDNAEHPPLGRWLLGLASMLGEPFEALVLGGPDPLGLGLIAARLAPASAFAVLVGLVVLNAGRRYGRAAGASAGFALLAMPRVFAHAHLEALDTFVCLFWTWALLGAEAAFAPDRPIASAAGAGVVWGLALLVKIHGWLLPPIVGVWALCRLARTRALAALACWSAAGFAVFGLGWPWLWYHPVERLRAYLGTGVGRSALRVQYFGRVYSDHDVPWHYPWFYFAVSVPVGLHALGALGVARGWRERRTDPFPLLLAGASSAVLGLFSTRVPVYDQERLFLLVFPLWALLIGRGFAAAWRAARDRRVLQGGLLALLLAQGFGLGTTHPFGLSYHNALVGGLPGAERLGLELTYWNDAVDPILLNRLVREVRPGQTAALAPTLYPGQGAASTTRTMARRGLVLEDQESVPSATWIVVSRRTAYWTPALRARLAHGQRVASRTCRGVWLSALWRMAP